MIEVFDRFFKDLVSLEVFDSDKQGYQKHMSWF